MRKILIILAFIFVVFKSYGQKSLNLDLSPYIERSFDYSFLKDIECDSVPFGLYAISFKLSKKFRLQQLQRKDSLVVLNILLTTSIDHALDSISAKTRKNLIGKELVQLIYFSNLECKDMADNYNTDSSINSMINKDYLLKKMESLLFSIENSFNEIKKEKIYGKKIYFLPLAIISQRPNGKHRAIDNFPNPGPSSDQIDKTKRQLQERRRGE